jgi:hypothetical protein
MRILIFQKMGSIFAADGISISGPIPSVWQNRKREAKAAEAVPSNPEGRVSPVRAGTIERYVWKRNACIIHAG